MESGRVVVKRFRQRSSGVASDLPVPEVAQEPAQHSQPSALDQVPTLPVQALTQDSAEQSQPPALAQGAQAPAPLEESPLSLQSWSLVQLDVPSCSARQLFLDDDDLEAAANPLQAAGHLPRGARASSEHPVLRKVAFALPRPTFAAPQDPRPSSSSASSSLPRPAYAAASAYDRGPRHRLEAAASGEPRSSARPLVGSGAVVSLQVQRSLPKSLPSFAVGSRKRAASPTADTAFQTSAQQGDSLWTQVRGIWAKVVPWLLALSPFLQELESRPNQQELLELLWKKNSATTVLRYLQSLFRVFSVLEDLTYECKAVSQLQLHDAVLALHRSFSQMDVKRA